MIFKNQFSSQDRRRCWAKHFKLQILLLIFSLLGWDLFANSRVPNNWKPSLRKTSLKPRRTNNFCSPIWKHQNLPSTNLLNSPRCVKNSRKIRNMSVFSTMRSRQRRICGIDWKMILSRTTRYIWLFRWSLHQFISLKEFRFCSSFPIVYGSM